MVPTLRIQLLGGFRLHVADIPVTTLDHPRLQALLAYLLLHRDTLQARQHLAFQLWPDSTEAQARTNLHSLLHRLRQALPHANHFLQIDAQTVQWRLDAPWALDVADMETALSQADQAEHAGILPALRSALTRAVEQYRGELLPALYDDWVLRERERLHQAWLTAQERLIVLLEGEHAYAAAIGYAQHLLRHDPLREATYQHLMRLHALSGDRASALRVYQTCVAVLEQELGVEPSLDTCEAYERLLHTEAPGRLAEYPAPHPPTAPHHNLPIALTSFIGRVHELAEVQRLLTQTRMLTLTGPGGCGKTRLALAMADEIVAAYPDGVWLVELAALTDVALLPHAVAAVVGVREEPQRILTATLIDAVRTKTMLLVLDNCEHLIDAAARMAATLLGACPRLRILATSREALGIAGETAWLVPSLALPDPRSAPTLRELSQVEVVRLFVERAVATLPTFTLTEANAAAVVQICRRLDGIPLAIELAAARVKVISVDQLVARLDDCFRLLTGGSRTALPRQQTLRAAIDWSYDLLSDQERALFRRLAVFAGSWTLEAAEAICAGGEVAADQVLELLARLVDKSLVVAETQAAATARYRLLEVVRQYSWETLRPAGEVAVIQQQHATFFLALAEAVAEGVRESRQELLLNQLEQEHSNLQAALAWSQTTEGSPEAELRFVAALWWFWWVRGYWSEGLGWLEKALVASSGAASNRAPSLAYAEALLGASWLTRDHGDTARAAQLAEESLALYRELGDSRGMADALHSQAWVAWHRGAYEQMAASYAESLALYRALGHRPGIAAVLRGQAWVALYRGDYQQQAVLAEESLALYRELGDRRGIADALLGLGDAVCNQGEYTRAAVLFAESLALYRELGDRRGIADALQGQGDVARGLGDYARGSTLRGESGPLLRRGHHGRRSSPPPIPGASGAPPER